MIVILFILLIVISLAFASGLAVFLHSKRVLREQKNYERGLQTVPLLIHLPPQADDTQTGGRDAREVADENISRAQVIYNIIASTYDKELKKKFHDQYHFSFEIVGSHGRVYFYAAVPIDLLEVVKQAIMSAYPTARLEEVEDHNIFNPVGKIEATMGGELSLKESYAFPIATYQELKRDAMQAILNALSTLDKEDGAAIQFLIRPADDAWRKYASSVADKKRKGDKGLGSPADLLKNLLVAPVKTPEDKSKSEDSGNDLSGSDQAIVNAIEEKTRYPGYEVQIRIITSSNISQRAQTILNGIVAAFSLFDAPGRNGFVYTPTEDIEEFVTAYMLRFFRPGKEPNILNSVELTTLFHFPDQSSIPTSQLSRQESKQVDGPRNVPAHGLLMGYNIFRGTKKPIRLALSDRQRHMYVVGQTGTGKSTFLENLALQDMLSGGGFAFVDPHGDTAERLLAMVPRERTEDVIYFSPADMDYPMGLNLFEYHTPDQKDFLIQEALSMLYKLYDPQHQGIMGPRYEHLFRNAALAVMADPAGGTFVDIPKLFQDPKYIQQKLQHVTDQTVLEFWQKEMPASQRSKEFGDVVSWFVSKFGAFLSNTMMRNIIGQTHSAFDMRDIMDNKKILLVNLSKGRTGELNSKLLGMIFVMKFQAAAMSRANIPEDERTDFSLYVDEFQNFSTESFATIMSEARKYHLNLIVANQFTTQLTEEIRDAVFGNMGTIVAFRVGQNDVEALSQYFQPTFDSDDLLRVPNFNTITRTLIGGVPTKPFSMATLPGAGDPNPNLAKALKQLSAAKYGHPKAEVEKEIFDRMKTVSRTEPVRPQGSNWPAATSPPTTAGRSSGVSAPATSSFLDDWLSKRKAIPSQPGASPSPINAAQPGLPPSPSSTANSSHPAIITNRQEKILGAKDASNIIQPATQKKEKVLSHSNSSNSKRTPQPASKNISSEATERQEVASIAGELKKNLKSNTVAPAQSSMVSKSEGEVKLRSGEGGQPAGEEDTIYIDREGNFRQKSE